MKIYKSTDRSARSGPVTIALGNFDGVHPGHQALIKRCVALAKETGSSPCVFTFANHPANVISGRPAVKQIVTAREKERLLAGLGIEILVYADFDEEMMNMPPEVFFRKYLTDAFRAEGIVCGFNYSFGKDGRGDAALLEELCAKAGCRAEIVPAVEIDGVPVSSTLIRKYIASGDMRSAARFLGRNYCIDGVVVHGNQIGRTIGFPTLNLSLSSEMALPPNGVYVTLTHIDGEVFRSVTNVGNKPTIGEFAKNAETHVFDFHKDIYGKPIKVEFLLMTRPERTFSGLGELLEQISRDCRNAEKYHNELSKRQ